MAVPYRKRTKKTVTVVLLKMAGAVSGTVGKLREKGDKAKDRR